MRTKPGLDTLSFDDLCNYLRVFKRDVKGTTASSSSNIQNVAFVSADNTSSTNDVSTAYSVSSPSVSKSQKEGSASYTDEAVEEEMVGTIETKLETIAKDLHAEEDTQNFAMMAYSFSNSGSDNESVFMNKECDLENTPVNDRYAEGMHTVPPPMTGNYMPSGPDVEIDYSKFTYGPKQTSVDESDSKTASSESDSSVETTTSMPEPVDNTPKVVSEPKVWTDAPIIKEYESDSDDDSVSNVQENIEKPSFAFTDTVKHVKSPRENVKETSIPNHYPKIEKLDRHSHTRKGLGYAFTRKSSFVCGSFSHLIRDYDFHEKRMAKQAALTKTRENGTGQQAYKPVWNNVKRVNHQNKHMTGNKAHLANYQEFKGGSVAFAGSNGRITGKGKIKAGRQHNMYSFNLKNIDPSGDLSCLFVKASIDESNKWHRRLGHVNFKNLNKLMKGNLVRGLPSMIFENDHTFVACQKEKQHKASCKAKTVSSVIQPLQILHMDLFGPISVRSINQKTYCVVITDGFSRFS
uniref:Putative ribonuclease H-like domain-containing protein n=1 Tax=Tanacetum cinerariifolium TaxID=118510 RepID=A0A699ILC2_TANCI|nr:putative ribonuclease H-like domain-containing protein [Tanacetum cinerariifolium]